ncbi:MAG: hypothetical protein ACOX63_11915 [Christensenellales bacterium]|jgi:hypothetical protein
MKRIGSVLMVLVILLYAAPALAQASQQDRTEASGQVAAVDRDARLDRAFDADALTLVETAWQAIAADDFDFPDALWQAMGTEKPADLHAQMATVLTDDVDITVLSISPGGNSAILTMNDTAIGYYEGKYRVLYPSKTRGVEDIHQNLETYSERLVVNILRSSDGVVYSRDGRYAAIYSTMISLMQAQFFLDPIIIDLSTGEIVLTATYGNKIRKENTGVVTTACFSADGRYFYYILYGNTTENRSALYRYDLVAETTELCCTIPYFAYYPQLSEMADGSLIMLDDTNRMDERTGILQMIPDGSQWRVTRHLFSLPVRHWYVQYLDYAVNTGYALMAARPDRGFAFMAVKPEESYAGLNRYLAIRRDNNAVEVLTEDSMTAALAEAARAEGGIDTALLPYHSIQKAVLSPDGHYALILTRNAPNTADLFLVRLEDLSCRKVAGIDPVTIQFGALAAAYRPMIEWHGDRLIIGTDKGIQMFRFQ